MTTSPERNTRRTGSGGWRRWNRVQAVQTNDKWDSISNFISLNYCFVLFCFVLLERGMAIVITAMISMWKRLNKIRGEIKRLKVCDEKKKNSFHLSSYSLFSNIKIYNILYILLYSQLYPKWISFNCNSKLIILLLFYRLILNDGYDVLLIHIMLWTD